jgi:hypothetical protein
VFHGYQLRVSPEIFLHPVKAISMNPFHMILQASQKVGESLETEGLELTIAVMGPLGTNHDEIVQIKFARVASSVRLNPQPGYGEGSSSNISLPKSRLRAGTIGTKITLEATQLDVTVEAGMRDRGKARSPMQHQRENVCSIIDA